MKSYIIRQKCTDPYTARQHYKNEDVLEKNNFNGEPIEWIYGNHYFSSEAEALSYLEAIASTLGEWEDDKSVEGYQLRGDRSEWYRGEGYYTDPEEDGWRNLLYQRGELAFKDALSYTRYMIDSTEL